jgi:hypothetical protein
MRDFIANEKNACIKKRRSGVMGKTNARNAVKEKKKLQFNYSCEENK